MLFLKDNNCSLHERFQRERERVEGSRRLQKSVEKNHFKSVKKVSEKGTLFFCFSSFKDSLLSPIISQFLIKHTQV